MPSQPATEPAISTPPAYLDRSETTVDPAPAARPWIETITLASEHPHQRMHRDHAGPRIAIIAAMLDAPDASIQKRAWKMRDCRAYPTVYLGDDGALHSMLGSCRDRACPTCASSRASDVQQRIDGTIATWRDMRLVTLTLNHRGEGLSDMIDRLITSYRRLRQTTLWRRHVEGAIAVIEVTWSPRTAEWHAHLHALTTGDYLAQPLLREAWRRASDGACIVGIERVHQSRSAANYIAKYISKPGAVASWPMACIHEWVVATRGRRLVIASGTAHGRCVDRRKPHAKPLKNARQLSWWSIACAYRDGLPAAHAMLAASYHTLPGLAAYVRDVLPHEWVCPAMQGSDSVMSLEALIAAIGEHAAGRVRDARPPPVTWLRRVRIADTPLLIPPPSAIS